MEYADSGDLTGLMYSKFPNEPIPQDILKLLCIHVLSALSYLHNKQLIHCDISLKNVFICNYSGNNTSDGKTNSSGYNLDTMAFKLGDFGLAKEKIDVFTTMAGGTAIYLAPEVAESNKVNEKADVWAFGVVLYQLITRDINKNLSYTVVRGESGLKEIELAVKQGYPINSNSNNSESFYDPWVWKLLQKCLVEDPNKRSSSEEILTNFGLLDDWAEAIYQLEPHVYPDVIEILQACKLKHDKFTKQNKDKLKQQQQQQQQQQNEQQKQDEANDNSEATTSIELNLRCKQLDDTAIIKGNFARCLSLLPLITSLDLTMNRIGNEGIKALTPIIISTTNNNNSLPLLKRLILKGNDFDSQGATVLLEGLMNNNNSNNKYCQLEMLSLEGNNLQNMEWPTTISSTTTSNNTALSSLQALNLARTSLTDSSNSLSTFISTLTRLNTLGLSRNTNITSTSIVNIANSLSLYCNNTLEHLILNEINLHGLLNSSNNTSNTSNDNTNSMIQFATSIGTLSNLKWLSLVNNNINTSMATIIAQYTFSKSSAIKTSLQILNLSENQIGDEGIIAISEALIQEPEENKQLDQEPSQEPNGEEDSDSSGYYLNLTSILLDSNNIGNNGSESIAKLLLITPMLEQLDLGNNNISDSGLVSISHTISKSGNNSTSDNSSGMIPILPMLQNINISKNPITDIGILALTESILKRIQNNNNNSEQEEEQQTAAQQQQQEKEEPNQQQGEEDQQAAVPPLSTISITAAQTLITTQGAQYLSKLFPKHIIDSSTSGTCTYCNTGNNYEMQAVYECSSCELTGGEDIVICETCATTCHKGHNLKGPSVGSYYCDCGAFGNICQSLDTSTLRKLADQVFIKRLDYAIKSLSQSSQSLPVNNSSTSDRILNMSNITLQSASVRLLSKELELLPLLTSITQLNLKSTHLDSLKLRVLYSGMIKLLVLEKLNISTNNIDDFALRYILDLLPIYKQLKELDLSHNQISYVGFVKLTKVITSNVGNLRVLSIVGNYYDDSIAMQLQFATRARVVFE